MRTTRGQAVGSSRSVERSPTSAAVDLERGARQGPQLGNAVRRQLLAEGLEVQYSQSVNRGRCPPGDIAEQPPAPLSAYVQPPTHARRDEPIRRVIVDDDQEPLNAGEVHQIRAAVERVYGGQAEARTLNGQSLEANLRHLDRIATEPERHRRGMVLAFFWMTGDDLGTADLPTGDPATPRPGLEVGRPSVRYQDDATKMTFDRFAAVLETPSEQGKPKFLVSQFSVPLIVRGFRSEDEPPSLALERAQHVRDRLLHFGFEHDIIVAASEAGTAGNFDYREMRRAEVMATSGESLTTPVVNDGRVLGDDARYAAYGVPESLAHAERLIDTAVGKLTTISTDSPRGDPTMQTFRRFFSHADPVEIAKRLRQTRSQIEHYRPHAPTDSDKGGGHACYDESRPGLLYLNDGVGSEARMIAGVSATTATPGNRAYNVVHEATHGAPELTTRDHAYRWQRLFPYLSPELQLSNADSYGLLVGCLAGLTEATTGMSKAEADQMDLPAPATDVRTVDLAPTLRREVEGGFAWIEHYVTQTYLNVRDLYVGLAENQEVDPQSYGAKLYDATANAFGLPPGQWASIAGIIDQLDDLKSLIAFGDIVFGDESSQTIPETFQFDVPSSLSGLVEIAQWELAQLILATKTIPNDLRSAHVSLINQAVRISSWGGPLN